MQRTKRGRPRLYTYLLKALKKRRIYSAATIVEEAVQKGDLPDDPKQRRYARQALTYIKRTANFPPTGDGLVHHPGQSPMPGWYGSRWQKEC